jgi:iron complex outermembrane receptor protein
VSKKIEIAGHTTFWRWILGLFIDSGDQHNTTRSSSAEIARFVVLCSSFVACGVHAQEASNPPEETGLEEVIVTARRVAESIQRVPVAISVFTADKLEAMGITNVFDLQTSIPGVNICCGPFFTPLIGIRGITSGVATYFADAPVSPNGYANYFDVDNFEVLRGPQGTLFGQAAVAGAFVFQPHKPGDTLGGYLSVSAGDFGRREIQGAVDLPLLDGHVLVRLAADSNYRDGYIHVLSTNSYFPDENYYIVRPSVTLKITDQLENYTMFQYQHSTDNGGNSQPGVLYDVNPYINNASLAAPVLALTGPSTPANTTAFYNLTNAALALQQKLGYYAIAGGSAGCATAATGPVFVQTPITSLVPSGTSCPYDQNIDQSLTNITTFTINDRLAVKNIFHYDISSNFSEGSPNQGLNTIPYAGIGESPLQNRPTPGPKIWSDEAQLQGKLGRFGFTLGTFNTKAVTDTYLYSQSFASQSLTQTKSSSASHALYGQTNIDLAYGLSATLGARFNEDKLLQDIYTYQGPGLTSYYTGPPVGAPGSLLIPSVLSNQRGQGELVFHNVSYTAGLQYQFTPDTMFFSTLSRGWSAGGFNAAGLPPYYPERLTNLETGLKSTVKIAGVETRLNASVYYGWFDDAQVNVYRSFTNASGQPMVGTVNSNAATAIVRGFDSELTVVPFKGLELGLTYSYNNDAYTQFEGLAPPPAPPGTPFNYSHTPFLEDPHSKITFHGKYRLPLIPDSVGTVSLTADASYQSTSVLTALPSTPSNPANPDTGLICTRDRTVANGYAPSVADGTNVYVFCQHPITNVDVGVQWVGVMGDEHLMASFTMTNVTRNIFTTSNAQFDQLFGYTTFTPALPQMWYVTLKYKY